MTEISWKSPDDPPEHMEPIHLTLIKIDFEGKPWVERGWFGEESFHTDKSCSICNRQVIVLGWSEWPEPAAERVEKDDAWKRALGERYNFTAVEGQEFTDDEIKECVSELDNPTEGNGKRLRAKGISAHFDMQRHKWYVTRIEIREGAAV